jgi:lipid-A-disaccharide synthase
MNNTIKIGIVAGEASGDLLGANLIRALQKRCPQLHIEGMGGPAMMAAGFESLFEIERLAVMGLIEPLFRLPDLIKLRRDLFLHFTQQRPDVFIGIDAPDFNLGLELKLRRAGIPIVHYVSPSVWAWRQNRVKKIAKAVDLMLTLFPFEAKFYERYHVPVRYVGHPLADRIPLQPDKSAARRALGLDEHVTTVALLPGSRRQEIRYMAEPFLLAAKQAWEKRPHLRFITSHVNEQRYQEFYAAYQRIAPELPLTFFTRHSQDVMTAADVAIVTSGTATLETMLYKTPMIIAYRMSPYIFPLVKWLVKTPYIGLPNILANELLVPELIQDKVQPDTIADLLLDYLDHPEKVAALKERFTSIHESLRFDSANSTADAILEILGV